MLDHLEHALQQFAKLCAAGQNIDRQATPGAGAAGGLGFALLHFFGARLQ